jgi:hypothetical protein
VDEDTMHRRLQIRSAFGPPPLVAGLLCAELVVFVVLLAAGVPWLKILTFAGLPIGITLGLLGPTLQELGKRQPKFKVSAADGDSVLHTSARPWPFDRARVIANEVADASASAENRNSALDNSSASVSRWRCDRRRPSTSAHGRPSPSRSPSSAPSSGAGSTNTSPRRAPTPTPSRSR